MDYLVRLMAQNSSSCIPADQVARVIDDIKYNEPHFGWLLVGIIIGIVTLTIIIAAIYEEKNKGRK